MIAERFSLKDKHAMVCGASRGIGRATAETLAAVGASVTLLARDADALSDTLRRLPAESGQTHRSVVADLSDPGRLPDLLGSFLAEAPPPQVLVNNSGGPAAGPILDAEPDAFLQGFTQHVIANHLLVQHLLPGMKASHYGRVINIVSTSVREPIPGLGVSNTIRAAVASWAKTLAREVAPFGITVNNVLPGFTATERLTYLFAQRAQASGRPVSAIEQDALAQVPMGRFARPREIADAVAFLASPAASYVSGVSLPVDGARTQSI